MYRGILFLVLAASSTFGCSLLVGEGFSEEPAPTADASTDSNASANDATTDASTPTGDGATDGASASRYAAAVLADKPIGYWRCGETTGSTLADSSNNNHPLTIASPLAVTLGKPGALAGDSDGAIELDGTTKLVAGDLFDFAGKVPFTFELWVKPRPSDGRLGYMFQKMKRQPNAVPLEGSLFYYDNNYGGGIRWGLERWTGGAAVQFVFLTNVAAKPPVDRFTHVVVAFDGTAPRLFLDGKLAQAGSGNQDIPDIDLAFAWADGLSGQVDELAVYDAVLTPTRIQAHFDAAK